MGPGFGRLWTAAAAGNLGDGVVRVAVALLALRLTRDPFAVSVITALSFLPWLVLGLPAGALVDRYDRRRLAFAVGLARAGAFAVLLVAVATDRASLWLLYGVVLAFAVCETVYDNSVSAMVPMIVTDRNRLEAANGRLQGVELVAQGFIGPPLASTVFALAAAAAFGIGTASFLVAALVLAALPGDSYRANGARTSGSAATTSIPRVSMRVEIGQALRYVRGHGLHRTLLSILVVLGFAHALTSGVMVLWARQVLGVGETAFGVFVLVMALGALAGSQTAAAVADRIGRGRAMVLSVLVGGIALLAAAATASAYLAAAALALNGWAILLWNVVGGALRQRITPNDILGRTLGIYRVVTWGVMPLGALAGGAVASLAGLRAPFVISGVLLLLTGSLAVRRLTNGRLERVVAEADAVASGTPRQDFANR